MSQHEFNKSHNNAKEILVVDLDGTLINTDMLFECVNQFVLNHPLLIIRLFVWMGRGRAYLKTRLAEFCNIDFSVLPYNKQVIGWLKIQKSQGRKIVLATASHEIIAEKIGCHLNLFDEVLATDEETNLKSEVKRDLLVEKYGDIGFEYLGNDWADLPIWMVSKGAYLVSPQKSLLRQARRTVPVRLIFNEEKRNQFLMSFKALRPHQWIKNLLLFVPLLAAHKYDSVDLIASTLIAFICFCFIASSAYLLNDLIDLESDRHHFQKKYRPFANGYLSLVYGWVLIPSLFMCAVMVSLFFLPNFFTVILVLYFGLTITYSKILKQVVILDVFTLAGLYTLRLFAGAQASLSPLSFWLLTFSMFIFLSLALIKRYEELRQFKPNNPEGSLRDRDYYPEDLELISSSGIAAGYISVLVMALYIQDQGTANLYQSPEVIWLAVPLLFYWISRVWLFAHRGMMKYDPILFAITDRPSILIGVLFVVVFAMARFI